MLNTTRFLSRPVPGVAALAILGLWTISVASSTAEDWPEWAGKGRLGNWNETGIMEKFPEGGLKVTWRKPIREGYCAPIVADVDGDGRCELVAVGQDAKIRVYKTKTAPAG